MTSSIEFDAALAASIPRLHGAARLFISNYSDRADLVQDTLLQALRKRDLYQTGSFVSWLIAIMRNLYLDGIRRAKRSPLIPDFPIKDDDLIAADEPSAGLLIRDLRRALSKLPIEQRRIVVAVSLNGDTYDNLAHNEGIPIGTVRSRISRGRAKVRQEVEGV